MPCNGCGSEFGIFKKEVGCNSCGFSFCSKCCNKRSCVSKSGETYKQVMCNKCFNSLSGEQPPKTSYSPPLAHQKRMQKFANRSVSLGSSSSYESEKDKEIAERLQKLKRERKKENMPSEGEIEERLAKLKGMDPAIYSAPPIQVYRPSDRRSSTEQVTDLMKQINEEVEIDKKRIKPEDEISARLARLKGEPEPVTPMDDDKIVANVCQGLQRPDTEVNLDEESQQLLTQQKTLHDQAMQAVQELEEDSELKRVLELSKQQQKQKAEGSESETDEEAEADIIIEKLLAVNVNSNEVGDPDSLNGVNLQSPTDSCAKEIGEKDTEEFPWCAICTEDAKMRCLGCDGDLYCLKCFKECHDSLDIKDHRTCPFLFSKVVP